MWGRLSTCAAVGYRRRMAANAAVGRLTIGRSLPSCPTRWLLRTLRDLLQPAGGLHGVAGGGDHAGGESEGVGKFGFSWDAEEVVHGADQVDRVDGAVLNFFAAGVGGAHHVPTPKTPAGPHRREALAVMPAPAVPRSFPLHFGRAAELAVPPDDGAREQAALREIGEQGRHTLIHLRQFAAHGLEIQLVGD